MADTVLTNKDGVEVFRGTSEPQPARNVGQCRLDFTAVAGDSAPIAFVFGQGDSTFIDLSTAANPKPVAAGIYGYTLQVNQDGGGDSGAFSALLTVDDDWYSLSLAQGAAGGGALARVSISTPWYSDAESPFHVAVSDSSADTYSGSLYVQCLAGTALG